MVVGLLYASHEAHLKSEQADVAQLVEQPIRNRQVSGSSPLVGSIVSDLGAARPIRPRLPQQVTTLAPTLLHSVPQKVLFSSCDQNVSFR